MEITLIRHAEMAGDPTARPARPVRGCLSKEHGLPQARALAAALKDRRFDLALASPLGRALQTAEMALAGRGVPIRTADFLVEWIPNPELEDAEEVVFERIQARDRSRYAEETWKTELGEGCFEMYARICPSFLRELDALGVHSRMGGFVPDKRARNLSLAVFAHGGTLNVLLSFLLRIPPFPLGAFAFQPTGVATIAFCERRGVYYPQLVLPAPAPTRGRKPGGPRARRARR
jgi:broad specificity phosphatase PhoE